MGLFSFAKNSGRKLGLFGGQQASAAEAAVQAAEAAKQAALAAAADAERAALNHRAVAADIQAAIASHGIAIGALTVAFDGETVTLTGSTASAADREKAVLVAGNTEGVSAVDDQIEVDDPTPPSLHHQVQAGDTLSKIALAQYGAMQLYPTIFEANQPMLTHPDQIQPGQVLRIPRVAALFHTVAKGETLGAIAKHHFGKAGRYTEIFEANRDRLASADAIEVGQRIGVPLAGPAVDPGGVTIG